MPDAREAACFRHLLLYKPQNVFTLWAAKICAAWGLWRTRPNKSYCLLKMLSQPDGVSYSRSKLEIVPSVPFPRPVSLSGFNLIEIPSRDSIL
jgi:hypothetical protein